jgi:rod shape-determining protein MreC
MHSLQSFVGARRTILLLIAVLTAAFLILPIGHDGPLKAMAGTVMTAMSHPLRVLDRLSQSIETFWSHYIALRQIGDENLSLHRQIARLQEDNNRLREKAVAADRLQVLLDLKEELPYTTIAARVIGRDPTNWYRSIVINKGQDDGVGVDMGVMTPQEAIGRVIKVQRDVAVVLLIIDRNNAVTGLIQRTRDEGIVEGTEKGLAWIKYLPLLSDVKVGDAVVTSGLAGGFPRGLPIGRITKIERREAELFLSAEIQPDTDFGKLEEVLVISSPGETVSVPLPVPSRTPTAGKRTSDEIR